MSCTWGFLDVCNYGHSTYKRQLTLSALGKSETCLVFQLLRTSPNG